MFRSLKSLGNEQNGANTDLTMFRSLDTLGVYNCSLFMFRSLESLGVYNCSLFMFRSLDSLGSEQSGANI